MNISLVIPAYNEEKYIGACLESVARNGEGLFEVIVVDNASTDKTFDIASSFPHVRVVKEHSKGTTHARKRGFLEAKGDIIAFIDADTKMPKGWVDMIVHTFSTKHHVVCLSGPYKYENVSWVTKSSIHLYFFLSWPVYKIVGYMAIGGNIAMRKSALDTINAFDTSIDFYGDDTHMAKQLHRVGKVLFLKKFSIHTSPRRFQKEGTLMTGLRYVLNFFAIVLRSKPALKKYTDVR